MALAYRLLPLVERTPDWWSWRRSGVTSSDAAIILGEARGKSVTRLLLEKQQPPQESARTFEQARSSARERQARAQFCSQTGVIVRPACVESLVRPWQRASLDGLSLDGTRVVEIKCGKAAYSSSSARHRPARHHYPQLQHILAVTDLPALDYWCYYPPHPPLCLEVCRDEAYIARLIAAEETFWNRLRPLPLPPR